MSASNTRYLLTLTGALLLATASAIAPADPPQGKGKGRDKHASSPAESPAGGQVKTGITAEQARRIAMEAGAHGYKPLPPGIRKNLARGKALPPGIAKRYAPAPMIPRLPPHAGHEWRVVGTDLVLVVIATAIVVDILSDVFR